MLMLGSPPRMDCFATGAVVALPCRHMYDFPLTGVPKTFLRSLGQTMDPALKVGKGGLPDEFFKDPLAACLVERHAVKRAITPASRRERCSVLPWLVFQRQSAPANGPKLFPQQLSAFVCVHKIGLCQTWETKRLISN